MKIINIPMEFRCGSDRRTVFLDKIGFDNIESFQTVELSLGLEEPYHTNKSGLVLCLVVTGWMEAHCAGHNYKLKEGQGIIIEPGEKHRINKGKGWMLSLSTKSYEGGLGTEWEESGIDEGGKRINNR
jgi:quercetin dioxygenase-like cupin family protein